MNGSIHSVLNGRSHFTSDLSDHVLCPFLYWGIYSFLVSAGPFLHIRNNIPNVFLLHPDFQSYLFFVFLQYLIFMWLSLPNFSFRTLVFHVMLRKSHSSFKQYKYLHFALIFVRFHFFTLYVFTLLNLFLCKDSSCIVFQMVGQLSQQHLIIRSFPH